uniref:Metallo-beta-lactamase domain-containing protein n=1 Tax=Wuchereria bancrofti TaxID=6293 RepID=A0AAF5PJM6_WUCBA
MAKKKECYQVEQLSINVYCIREDDYCNHKPLMYLIIGTQKGNNWQFSSLGPNGLTVNVEALCASDRNTYYTELRDSEYDRQLGDSDDDKLEVLHAPGHTPDSLSLWYNAAKRLFIDLFHQYNEVMLTYLYIFESINIF